MSRVTAQGAHRCRSHQHEERRGLVGACRVPALAAVATLKNKRFRAAVVDGGCDVPEVPVVNKARLRSKVACQQAALLGTRTCGNEALRAELRGVRQAYNVSVPTFRLRLDLLAFQAGVFRCRPTYPVAAADETRSGHFRGCLKSSRSANATGGPMTFLSRFHPTQGQVLARVLGRPLFSERGCAALQWRHGAGRQDGGRLHGPSTLREGPPRQNECCEVARLQEAHRVTTRQRDTYEWRRGHMVSARRVRPVIPVL